jgi:heptosyltransferase-2
MFKILVIAPSWVGDAVMAQPLLRRLKEQRPDAVIDVFAPAWVAPVLERMPEVRRIIANPLAHGELRLPLRWRLGRALRKERYDQALVLPNSLKSALIPFFAGIPRRTGFVGEARYGLLNDARRLDKKALPLMVERFAALAAPPFEKGELGGISPKTVFQPRLTSTGAQQQAALDRLALAPRKPVAAFCPGAEYGPAKRWPAPYFAELAQALAAQGYEVWLLGSGKDAQTGEEIERLSQGTARNLCGKTDLAEAIDLLAAASLVITNDSGLMHVAAALDRPMIAIFGSSSPGFTPPLSGRARILSLNLPCSPCFKRECPLGHFDCMRKLTPERVAGEIGKPGGTCQVAG